MVRKRSPSNKDTQQPKIDDLKLIKGIGPVVEQRLLDDGIYTFAHLAAFLPADIAARLTGLSGMTAERIIREDWIGQARKLAAESTSNEAQKHFELATDDSVSIEHARAATPLIESQKTGELGQESMPSEVKEEVETPVDTKQVAAFTAPVEPIPPIKDDHTVTPLEEPHRETETNTPEEQHHHATFTVEFLLDENNYVHNARVMHLESQREHTWSGWPNTELVDFLSESVEMNIQSVEWVLPNTEEHVLPAETVHAPVKVAESKPISLPETVQILTGQLHVREMEIIGATTRNHIKTLARNTPFDVRLILDLSDLRGPHNTPLNYLASIYCKSNRSGLVLGQIQGTIVPADTITIIVKGNMLSKEGIYQLVAQVMLGLPTTKLRIRPGTTALKDGGHIQIL